MDMFLSAYPAPPSEPLVRPSFPTVPADRLLREFSLDQVIPRPLVATEAVREMGTLYDESPVLQSNFGRFLNWQVSEGVTALQLRTVSQDVVTLTRPAWPLSGPMQFLLRLLETWELQRRDAVLLLGFEMSERQYVDRLMNGMESLTGRDVKDRIAYLFQIRKALAGLFRNVEVENDWLREYHPMLDDRSPMELLLKGSMEYLLVVRDYVLVASGK